MNPAVGLIVNPVAGIGGPAALKGSDGAYAQGRALLAGSSPRSGERAALTLRRLLASVPGLTVLVPGGPMGEQVARDCGVADDRVRVVLSAGPVTTGQDTSNAARAMALAGIRLIMFAGGDGTARDVARGAGQSVPVLGIPAGVKMQSAVFAVSPAVAASIASAFLTKGGPAHLREVVDIDERALRDGRAAAQLHGYLPVPDGGRRVQDRKSGSTSADAGSIAQIAAAFAGQMRPGRSYVLGPGLTMKAVADRLGVPSTLLGVDVVSTQGLVAADVTAWQLDSLVDGRSVIAVSPVGGQGFLFGRGNQQIGAGALGRVGLSGIAVLCTHRKLASLRGAPLLIDTGDAAVDASLTGYLPVTTGPAERTMYRTQAAEGLA